MIAFHSKHTFEQCPTTRKFCRLIRLCGYVMCLCAYPCKIRYSSQSIASKSWHQNYRSRQAVEFTRKTHRKTTKPKNSFGNLQVKQHQYLCIFRSFALTAQWLGLCKLSTSPAVNSSLVACICLSGGLSVRVFRVNWTILTSIFQIPVLRKQWKKSILCRLQNPLKKKTGTGNGLSRWVFTKFLSHVRLLAMKVWTTEIGVYLVCSSCSWVCEFVSTYYVRTTRTTLKHVCIMSTVPRPVCLSVVPVHSIHQSHPIPLYSSISTGEGFYQLSDSTTCSYMFLPWEEL